MSAGLQWPKIHYIFKINRLLGKKIIMDDALEKIVRTLISGKTNRPQFTVPQNVKYLDSVQLAELERCFRFWSEKSPRQDVRVSRKRLLLVFLLIRYTAAKTGEVIRIDEQKDIDLKRLTVRFGGREQREVQIPAELGQELKAAIENSAFDAYRGSLFRIDPGHLRRKFYERAVECGLPSELASPTVIRRSRAIELLRDNVPLPVVQRFLGHSTPSLTADYLDLSPEDMKTVIRHYVDEESRRKTSARNTFFGKLNRIEKGDIQSLVELVSLGGHTIAAIVTNESLERLKLAVGTFATAEIKAPWVIVARDTHPPRTSARNKYPGILKRINRGRLTTEYSIDLADGTEVCSVVTEDSRCRLNLHEGDEVWVMFNAFAVILNVAN